jgi:hypothetical protein
MELCRSVDAQVEAQGLKMEPWRACKSVVAYLHYFEEERDPHQSNSQSRIRIKSVKRDLDPNHSTSDPDSELFQAVYL